MVMISWFLFRCANVHLVHNVVTTALLLSCY